MITAFLLPLPLRLAFVSALIARQRNLYYDKVQHRLKPGSSFLSNTASNNIMIEMTLFYSLISDIG